MIFFLQILKGGEMPYCLLLSVLLNCSLGVSAIVCRWITRQLKT